MLCNFSYSLGLHIHFLNKCFLKRSVFDFDEVHWSYFFLFWFYLFFCCRSYFLCPKKCLFNSGAPGWLSQLSVPLLFLAQVIISWS